MPKLIVFNSISLDGFFTDAHGDMSWAHQGDPEWNAWVAENASDGGMLVFGRVTYDMMAGWWPTPAAASALPVVAERMNSLPKLVFSRTMAGADWSNTRLVKSDPAAEILRLKAADGPDMVIMGSGTIVSQLSEARLVDEYQVVVSPVVLGGGRTMFEGVKDRLPLKLTKSRQFENGNMVLWYSPVS